MTLNVVGVFTGIISRVCRERSRKEEKKKRTPSEQRQQLRGGKRLVDERGQRSDWAETGWLESSNSQWVRARSAMSRLSEHTAALPSRASLHISWSITYAGVPNKVASEWTRGSHHDA